MNGDKDGKWSEMHNPDMASPTVSAINLSLASRFTLSIYATSGEIGGNSNNYVSRSSGNNGNSNSGQNVSTNKGLISSIVSYVSKVDDAISSSSVTKGVINSINKTNFTLPQAMNAIGKYTNPLAVGISLDNMIKDPSLYNVVVATGNVGVIAVGYFTGVEEWSLAWSAATIGSGIVNDALNK